MEEGQEDVRGKKNVKKRFKYLEMMSNILPFSLQESNAASLAEYFEVHIETSSLKGL